MWCVRVCVRVRGTTEAFLHGGLFSSLKVKPISEISVG